jgi:hypothetical protein
VSLSAKLYAARLAPVLRPGEVALDVWSNRWMVGDDSGLPDTTDGPRERSDRWVTGFDWLPPFVYLNTDRFERLWFGQVGRGEAGSVAARLHPLREPQAGPGTRLWALTNQRILLSADRPVSVVAEVPLASVTRLAYRPALLLQYGRVELTFDDGSRLALLRTFLDPFTAWSLTRRLEKERPHGGLHD